jgi:RND superfamily putative drug exporter
MLARLARSSYVHRRRVVLAWVALAVVALALGSQLAGPWASGGRLPGTDSQRALDVLEREFPAHAGDDGAIVFAGVTRDRAGIDRYLHEVARVRGIDAVAPLEVARGGRVAIAPITLSTKDDAVTNAAVERVQRLAGPLRRDGVRVEFAGGWFSTGSMPATEMIGLLAAVVVLIVAFGSIVAMGAPIVTALAGIAVAITGVGIVANFLQTPDFAPQVAMMIGLGVGIDYALFIVTRYRAALARGAAPQDAVLEAVTTSGRAVVFAGCTVVVSLLGMLVMGLSFLYGFAVSTSLAVAISVAAAVTLLPAMLGFLGTNIDRLRVHRRGAPVESPTFARWARTVQQRPGAVAIAGFTVLVLAALPVLGMRLGVADAGNDPASSTTAKAYHLVARGFGAGANGPMTLVVDGRHASPAQTRAATAGLVRALRATPGVVHVNDATPSPSGAATIATLVPRDGPQDPKTVTLLHHLRDDVVPGALASHPGVIAYVGGQTAFDIDFATVLGDRLPEFIIAVLVCSFVLLLAVFRSVVVPLKAVVMNLLSIGAAYGVIVAVFQWGWFGSVLGVTPAPIEPWVPMMTFAIVFGLSMDYEVFLLSTIREEYERTGDNRTAVTRGLASTARLITAAALIMVFVFASFVTADVRVLKLIGLGLAVAVAIDATVVRIVLVTATKELLGRANWWMPRWLDRLLPHVHVDGGAAAEPVTVRGETRELVDSVR